MFYTSRNEILFKIYLFLKAMWLGDILGHERQSFEIIGEMRIQNTVAMSVEAHNPNSSSNIKKKKKWRCGEN